MRASEACYGACFLVFHAGTTYPANRMERPSDRPIGDPGVEHLP